MGWLSDLDPTKAAKSIGDALNNIKKKADDIAAPVRKFAEAPIKSLAASDPFYQRLKTGRWQSPNTLIAGGVHELYDADPLAKNIGIREKDAVTAAKVAGAAAAIYFSAGAASSMYGSAAAVSGEGGAVASASGSAFTASSIGATAGAVSAVGQIYGTVQQRKAIQQAKDQARQDQQAMQDMIENANQPAPVMPGPDAASIATARKRSLAEQQRRRGRSASILSDDSAQPLGA